MKALELIERVGQEPTLDVAMDRDPMQVSERDLRDIVQALRAQRAYFAFKSRKAPTAEEKEDAA